MESRTVKPFLPDTTDLTGGAWPRPQALDIRTRLDYRYRVNIETFR